MFQQARINFAPEQFVHIFRLKRSHRHMGDHLNMFALYRNDVNYLQPCITFVICIDFVYCTVLSSHE